MSLLGLEIVTFIYVMLFSLGGWFTHACLMMYATLMVPNLEDLEPSLESSVSSSSKDEEAPPSSWPSLSVIVPACNEEDTIEQALQTLCDLDYPNLQVIVINDRSTDKTGEIIDRLAAKASHLTPLHIETLPQGWLGKVHAMHQAVQHVTGEWMLLTDADVHFSPNSLKRAVAFATAKQLDFVTAVPDVTSHGFWYTTAAMAMGELFSISGRIWEIDNPTSTAFGGAGQFNLIRKSKYDESQEEYGGFEWLKMEPLEDVGTGLLMKIKMGAKAAIVNGRGQVSFSWYSSLSAMFRGTEKILPSLVGWSYFNVAMLSLMLWLTAIAPIFCFVPYMYNSEYFFWLPWFGVAILLVNCIYGIVYSRWANFSPLAGICIPLGKCLIAAMFANALWQLNKRKGIIWRGTFYPEESLREGNRIFKCRPK